MPRLRAGGAQIAKELIGGLADQRVEDEGRARGEDRVDRPGRTPCSRREIPLGDDRAAVGANRLAQDPVVLPRPDVVGADAESLRADVGQQIFDERQQMLVRDRAGVDDVARAFEALVVRRIPEERVRLLEQRNDLFAARRGVAPDHMADAAREHVRGHRGIARVVSSGIGDDRINLEIRDAPPALRRCRAARRKACFSRRRCKARPTKSGCRQVRAIWPQAAQAPKHVGATSQTAVGAIAVAFEVYLAGSLSGRFAPRLTPRTSTPPGGDFGRMRSEAIAVPDHRPVETGLPVRGIAEVKGGTRRC